MHEEKQKQKNILKHIQKQMTTAAFIALAKTIALKLTMMTTNTESLSTVHALVSKYTHTHANIHSYTLSADCTLVSVLTKHFLKQTKQRVL